MEDSKNTNFRIIIALTTLPQDLNLNGTSLKVTLANSTKSIPLTNKEATPLDFSGVKPGAKIEFGLEDTEGFMFGYAELKVPSTAFEKNETEVNEQIRFFLINKEKDSFIAGIFAIFLNKGLFKEKVKEKTVPKKSPSSPLKNIISSGYGQTRSPSGSPLKKSPSKGKLNEGGKTHEKNFQAYLNRLVDTHSVQLKNLVDEHNSINEYIQLNKLQNNLPPNFANDSLETYSPTKLKSSSTKFLGDSSIEAGTILPPEEARLVESASILKESYISQEREKRAAQEESFTRAQQEASARRESASRSPLRRGNSERSPSRVGDRSPSRSPLRSKLSYERKFSEVSSANGSPSKRRPLAETIAIVGDRAVPDVTYYNAQINHLNNVIVNQSAQLTDKDIHQRENEELRVTLDKADASRKILQESILETTNELKQENRNLEKQVANVIVEKEGLLRKNAELQSTVNDLTNVLSATRLALQEKEDLNAQNAIKLADLNDLRQQFIKIQNALINSEAAKIKDQEAYKAALASFEVSLQDTTRTIDLLNLEKKKLVTELHQVQQELGIEKANHSTTQNELLLTKKKLENAENYKHAVASLESQRDQLTSQLAESRANHANVVQTLQESIEKLAVRQREFETTEKILTNERNTLGERLSTSEGKNDRLVKEIGEQKLKVSQLLTNISGLEQLICVKEDISKQLEVANQHLEQVLQDRNALRNQLESVNVNHEVVNNKLVETEKNANILRAIIEEREDEVEQLTVALRELQDVYVPQKGDDIDNALADYINSGNNVTTLKLLFIREAEGVYQFGSKRIYVKLEAGKALIRVGGGFLTLDEFIDQYGPLEMEKLARTDPIKRLSRNIAVNKTLIGKCVNQMEKAKTTAYEYRSDGTGTKLLNSSPSLQRLNSKGDY